MSDTPGPVIPGNPLVKISQLVTENKIIGYLLFTATMVVTFACALVITNTAYGVLGWLGLLVVNVGGLVYLSLK